MSDVDGAPTGERVTRVAWLPGGDRLRGECSCGARADAAEPVGLWAWLLAHPDHPADGPTDVDPPLRHRPPAHRVLTAAQAAGPRTPVR